MPPHIRRTITVKRAEPSKTPSPTTKIPVATNNAALERTSLTGIEEPGSSRDSTMSALPSSSAVRTNKPSRAVLSTFGTSSTVSANPSSETRMSVPKTQTRKRRTKQRPMASHAAPSPESATTSLARMYGLASGSTLKTATSTQDLQASPASPLQETPLAFSLGRRDFSTAAEPTHPAASRIPYKQEAYVPEPPTWVVFCVGALLAAGFFLAIVLYFANFPTTFPRGTIFSRKRKRYGYDELENMDLDLDGDDFLRSPDPRTTGISSSCSPHLRDVRRRPQTPGLGGMGMGLGISMTEQPSRPRIVRKRPSFEEDAARLYKPFPKVPVKSATNAWRSLTDPLPSVKSFLAPPLHPYAEEEAFYELRERRPDIESGLLKTPSPDFDSPSSGNTSRSSSSSRISSTEIFTKISDGVESVAAKVARMLDHQVREDPEDGLMLPLRAVRGSRKVENGKLKKVC